MLKEMKVKKIIDHSKADAPESLELLFDALKAKADSDKFISKEIENCIEDLGRRDHEDDHANAEPMGSLSDQNLINRLPEKAFQRTLIERNVNQKPMGPDGTAIQCGLGSNRKFVIVSAHPN
jgi:hypothetical protein